MLLNSDKINSDSKFKGFTFLGADVENNGNTYNVDINGIATNTNKQKAYTTLNYCVDGNYLIEKTDNKMASNAKFINELAKIIQNEQFSSYSILNVDSVKNLNTTIAKVTPCNLGDDYKCENNFLYAVNNLTFNEQEQLAYFSTKELIRFSNLEVNYWAFTENGPIYTINGDRQSFFVNQDICIELSPEEIANAKNNSSIVFSKLAEYVDNKQNDKYVVNQTAVSKNQEQGIVMNEEVSLSNA